MNGHQLLLMPYFFITSTRIHHQGQYLVAWFYDGGCLLTLQKIDYFRIKFPELLKDQRVSTINVSLHLRETNSKITFFAALLLCCFASKNLRTNPYNRLRFFSSALALHVRLVQTDHSNTILLP